MEEEWDEWEEDCGCLEGGADADAPPEETCAICMDALDVDAHELSPEVCSAVVVRILLIAVPLGGLVS